MERREFIQAGALWTLLAFGGRRALAGEARLSREYMDGYLRRLDEQRAWMATAPMDGVFQAVAAGVAVDRTRCDALLRQVLRSTYLARSFRDLPEHGRAHPGMQRRILDALPEMDKAVSGTREYLVNLSPADHLDLRRTVRDHPQILPRLALHLDEEAEKVGISDGSRRQVRGMVEHLDRQFRLRDTAAVIDDYVARADRAAAEAGSLQEMFGRLQARLGSGFATEQQRQVDLARSWWEEPRPKDYPGAGQVYRMGDPPPDELEWTGRRRMRVKGAWVLGIGVVNTVLGLAFIPLTMGVSSVATTIGLPMVIAGIVLLALGSRDK